MDADLKVSLYTKVDDLAPEYGLDDLTFPSFYRKSGYRSDISSSDAVEGLGALLEVATGVRLDFGTGADAVSGAGGREEWKAEGMRRWIDGEGDAETAEMPKEKTGEEDEEEGAIVKADKLEIDWGTRNFWLAWDALSTECVFARSGLQRVDRSTDDGPIIVLFYCGRRSPFQWRSIEQSSGREHICSINNRSKRRDPIV